LVKTKGSGKTWTMQGEVEVKNSPNQGLMPRVFNYIFGFISTKKEEVHCPLKIKLSIHLFCLKPKVGDQVEYHLQISCIEIYNERIQDLLDLGNGDLAVRDNPTTGPFVQNLYKKSVTSAEECLNCILEASKNRKVSSTGMNAESSRSHLICTLEIHCKDQTSPDGITKERSTSFNLVDLAGSERQKKTNARG